LERELAGCWECGDYPCERLGKRKDFKGICSHCLWQRNDDEIRRRGLEAWTTEYEEKARYMRYLLERYNYGRLKSFICNLLTNSDLETIRKVVNAGKCIPVVSIKVAGLMFREMAEQTPGVKICTPDDEEEY
jgi:hypothetical protein